MRNAATYMASTALALIGLLTTAQDAAAETAVCREDFAFTGTIEMCTIGASGSYRIAVFGAQGGNNGGLGGQAEGTVTLSAGDMLRILVGEGPSTGLGGGGGGSFVESNSTALIVGGGGGGGGGGFDGGGGGGGFTGGDGSAGLGSGDGGSSFLADFVTDRDFQAGVRAGNGAVELRLLAPTPVPLPAGATLLATGVLSFGALRRRRKAA